MIELDAERGRVRLHMRCISLGEDLCITLSGGDREHIGAVALARPGEHASTLAVPGHREEELAREIAQRIANHSHTTVCVTCGIHLDKILPSEIEDVLDVSRDLTETLSQRLS